MQNQNTDGIVKTSKKTAKIAGIAVVAILSIASIAMASFAMPAAKSDIELATINYQREVDQLRTLEAERDAINAKIATQEKNVSTSECDLAAVKLANFQELNATEEQKKSWSEKSSWGCLGK